MTVTNSGMRPTIFHTNTESNSGRTNMTKKVALLAIPVLITVALVNIPTAEAVRPAQISAGPGPSDPCTTCMNSCDQIPYDFFKLACWAFCIFKVC